jgi:hypothetical protein
MGESGTRGQQQIGKMCLEKIAQNVAQSPSSTKILADSVKVKYRQIGEKSPNLVTLATAKKNFEKLFRLE